MKNEALAQALPRALLVLRITLGLFLLQWGVEKFAVPQNTVAIWSYFYGLEVSRTLGYAFGVAEIAIAGGLFLGLFRTVTYGAAMAVHAVSVLVSWRQLLDPWGDPANHLFIAGVPYWERLSPCSCCGTGTAVSWIGNGRHGGWAPHNPPPRGAPAHARR